MHEANWSTSLSKSWIYAISDIIALLVRCFLQILVFCNCLLVKPSSVWMHFQLLCLEKFIPKDVFEVLYFSTTKWTPLQLQESKPKKRNGKIDFDLCACFYVSNFVGFNNVAWHNNWCSKILTIYLSKSMTSCKGNLTNSMS
jgi:hypothetical protein